MDQQDIQVYCDDASSNKQLLDALQKEIHSQLLPVAKHDINTGKCLIIIGKENTPGHADFKKIPDLIKEVHINKDLLIVICTQPGAQQDLKKIGINNVLDCTTLLGKSSSSQYPYQGIGAALNKMIKRMQNGQTAATGGRADGLQFFSPLADSWKGEFIKELEKWICPIKDVDLANLDTTRHFIIACSKRGEEIDSDIDVATRDIDDKTWDKSLTILLYVHHVVASALPRVKAENKLRYTKYRNMGLTLDVAYQNGKPLADCDKHRELVSAMKLFLGIHQQSAIEGAGANQKTAEVPNRKSVRGTKSKECSAAVPIQIYFPYSSSWKPSFYQSLTIVLSGLKEVDLDTLDVTQRVIVICPKQSRIEPDIDSSLQKIREKIPDTQIIVVYVHMVPKESLPSRTTEKRLGGNDKYKDIALILDVAYTNEEKIHDCSMNIASLSRIREAFQIQQNQEPLKGTASNCCIM